MLDTAKQHILLPLVESGHHAFVVGGTVRDTLFGCEVHDVDICTDAPEEVLSDLFPDCCLDISKNMNLKVFLIGVNGYKYEVAHFRGNEKHPAHRHHDYTEATDIIKQDAMKRDFTINSLYMDISGNIIDYAGGQEDCKNKILRCVDDCDARFDEDILRILRGIRLAVKFDLMIEEKTRRAMFDHCERLLTLPPERILDEIHRMMALGGKKFSKSLKIMRDTGVLGVLLPEIARLKDFEHDREYHPEGHVLPHVIAAVAACESTDPDVLWAVLLHDVGKATTYKLRHKGTRGMVKTYYGHGIAGIPIIEALAARLGFPNRTRDIAVFCAAKHMTCHKIREMRPGKVLLLAEHPYFQYVMEVADCDVQCRGDEAAADEVVRRKDFMKNFRETTQVYASVVTGTFVMDTCNVLPGPRVGKLIAKLKEFIADKAVRDPETIRKKLLELKKSMA